MPTLRSMLLGPQLRSTPEQYQQWRRCTHDSLGAYLAGLPEVLRDGYAAGTLDVLLRELDATLQHTSCCDSTVTLACRQTLLLFAMYMEEDVADYFVLLDPTDGFAECMHKRVLPRVIPPFIERCMSDPPCFVRAAVELTLAFQHDLRRSCNGEEHASQAGKAGSGTAWRACTPPPPSETIDAMANAEFPPPAGSTDT